MSFSAVELNYLILRYLEENGFTHSAFLFGRESLVADSEVDGSEVPNGALVNVVQKGLAFAEYEMKAGGSEEGKVEDVPNLSLLEAVSDDSVKQRARERLQQNFSSGDGAGPSGQSQRDRERDIRAERSQNGGGQQPRRDRNASSAASPSQSRSNISSIPQQNGLHNKKQAAANGLHRNNISCINNDENAIVTQTWKSDCEIERSKVKTMKQHTHEVFIVTWNPKREIIGTGSGDSTARIWDVTGSELPTTSAEDIAAKSIVLKHSLNSSEPAPNSQQINKDVTSIDWDCSGNWLATGCYDGFARVWSVDGGRLHGTLGAHKGPIFALKWNEKGNYILSAGVDKTTIIWDVSTTKVLQSFTFHTSSALDVDWLSEDTFASCSTDRKIHVCKLYQDKPQKTFEGHTNEVNAVRWDRHSQRLASCSDDQTLKIWSLNSDKPVLNATVHKKEIYTIRWAPTGYVLASASFDHTVCLWDVNKGICTKQLERHTEPVYSVSFSPDGRYIASGSFDRCIYIWDVKSGKVVLSYTGEPRDGGIFEVNWNPSGEKLAASASDGRVLVMDVRQLGAQRLL